MGVSRAPYCGTIYFVTPYKNLGFTLNLYDPCVANANIKGSQCTIVWYVDDNKISHKDQAVVDDLIQRIEAKFGHMTKPKEIPRDEAPVRP